MGFSHLSPSYRAKIDYPALSAEIRRCLVGKLGGGDAKNQTKLLIFIR